MVNIRREKDRELVRWRFERLHGEVCFRRFLKYYREGLRQSEILVLMRKISRRHKRRFVRYWYEKFVVFCD